MENQYIKRITVMIFVGIMTIISISAQRVFIASENGKIEEIKGREGEIWKSPLNIPTKIINSISDPLILYFFYENPFDIKEWKFSPTGSAGGNNYVLWKFYKPSKINQLSAHLTRMEFKTTDIWPEGRTADMGVATVLPYLSIAYEPSKQNKKKGVDSKRFIVSRSKLSYDPDEIEWSDEDAIASINEIIDTKQTTKQLFASLVPEPQPQVIQGNGQVQYVVVQNPNSPVQGNEVAQQPKEPEIPNSDVDVNIPFNGSKIENGFALIIANEDYTKVAPVPFAKRDGKKVEEYVNKALGIDKGHITLLENATLNDMRYELSRLKKISEAYNGDCSFIVYYCGHGIPDEKNGNGYLLPVDGYGTDVNTAYSLSDLYSQLGNLNARKTILFTDACFSGAGKEGSMLVAARGIAIKSKANEASGNLIAFSACQGDETAYSYKDKGHGLMTYYFLKKLQESQGKVTLGELEEYIIDNVGKTAIVTNGKSQTPSVSVSPTLQNDWRQQTLFD